MAPLLEIAAFSLAGAITACEAGANRIELCADYTQGGLSPLPEVITAAIDRVTCPVFVMIRPEPGDFMYRHSDLERMKAGLMQAKHYGAGGFVFGILQEDGGIDEAACRALIALAAPLPCTFHRAFDDLPDKAAGLEQLIRCGFRRVLTSGGLGRAVDHVHALKALVGQAAGRIIIMPGGGVRPANLAQLMAATGAPEYHSAAIASLPGMPDEQVIADMKRQLGHKDI